MIEIICCILESHIKDFEVKLNEGVDPSIMLQEQTNANLVAVLAKLIEKSERQKDLLEDGIYSKADYIKRNAKTQSEIEMVKKKIDEIKIEKPIDYNEKIEYFSKAVEMMRTASADPAALNKLLKSIIEKIEYKSTTNTARIKASNLRGGWDSNQFNIDIFLRL